MQSKSLKNNPKTPKNYQKLPKLHGFFTVYAQQNPHRQNAQYLQFIV